MRIIYIDLHNIGMSFAKMGWRIARDRFAVYLKEKYHIDEMRAYIGYKEQNKPFYTMLESLGYVMVFRESYTHQETQTMKANVDTEIVYDVIIHRYNNPDATYFLATCDGDYDVLIKDWYKNNCMGKLFVTTRNNASRLLVKHTIGKDLIELVTLWKKILIPHNPQESFYTTEKVPI